jgi:hypothetical protein
LQTPENQARRGRSTNIRSGSQARIQGLIIASVSASAPN